MNDANSCDFSGTAERKYTLKDGDLGEQDVGQCLIKDSANAYDICGSMQWACYDQNYADVSRVLSNNYCLLSPTSSWRITLHIYKSIETKSNTELYLEDF